jgi:hypothetical protein
MTPKEAYLICLGRKRRSPDLEGIISIDPYYSFLYAKDIIKGPFIEGGPDLEGIISIDPYYSYVYARDIIKGPFKKGEKVISTDIHHSYHYAVNVIKTAFPLCHQDILYLLVFLTVF